MTAARSSGFFSPVKAMLVPGYASDGAIKKEFNAAGVQLPFAFCKAAL